MILILMVIALATVFLAHTAPFPFVLDALEKQQAVWQMPPGPSSDILYLTFDDGPNIAVTPALLDVLARERTKATFFVIDRHITEETAHVVRRMFLEGHAVALHSDSRALMMMPPEQLASMLQKAADRIHQLTGFRPCPAFRPHAGWRSGSMYEGLKRINFKLVGWGWMLWDWNWNLPRTADSVVRRILDRASDGDIIVLHDGHHVDPRADRQYAVDATAQLIPALRARGFSFGTICNAL